jgi:hypothetical protein
MAAEMDIVCDGDGDGDDDDDDDDDDDNTWIIWWQIVFKN